MKYTFEEIIKDAKEAQEYAIKQMNEMLEKLPFLQTGDNLTEALTRRSLELLAPDLKELYDEGKFGDLETTEEKHIIQMLIARAVAEMCEHALQCGDCSKNKDCDLLAKQLHDEIILPKRMPTEGEIS